MEHLIRLSEKHGLTHSYEGVIPVRVCGVTSDEILGVYKYYHRGGSVQGLRDLITSLQESIDAMVAAGME